MGCMNSSAIVEPQVWPVKNAVLKAMATDDFSQFQDVFDYDNAVKQTQIMASHRPTLLERRKIKELEDIISEEKTRPKGTLEEAYQLLDTWDMPYLNFDRQILLKCFIRMFENLDFISKFGVEMKNLVSFLNRVG